MNQPYNFETLLPSYFSGKLNQEEKQMIEDWKNSSEENLLIFKNAEKVWKSLDLLQEMKTYDAGMAMRKVNNKIGKSVPSVHKGFIFYWQRIAAVLLLPVLIGSMVFFFFSGPRSGNDSIVWQTISTPPGLKSQTRLPDGTKVWLNSDSRLSYPSCFTGDERNVKLEGEAYFEVVKNERQPFYVDLGNLGIEVTGTTFNAINYTDENQTEVILASGKVRLVRPNGERRQEITEMDQGQKAVFRKSSGKISLENADTEKYISWIDGRLIFRDDDMTEVVKKLSRWFNVEIQIADPEIAQYVYTATFREEPVEQILYLLKKTSPIEYDIVPGKRLNDGSFEKQKIILRKR